MYTGNGITHVYMYASTQEKFYLLFSLILHAQQNHMCSIYLLPA